MFRTYLKIAWRNILKEKQFTFLNLIGLCTGLTSALLIYLWVSNELHMDKLFKDGDQVFQAMKNVQVPGNPIRTIEWTPGVLAKSLAEEMPEVEYGVTVVPNDGRGKGVISFNEQKQIRAGELYASSDFFNVFSYPLVFGDRSNLLKTKQDVVISDELARSMFNTTENVIGKRVEWSKEDVSGYYVISGVFKKPRYNSSSQFDLVFAYEDYRQRNPSVNDWGYNGPSTYVLLKENVNVGRLNQKLGSFLQQKTNDQTQSLFIRKYTDKYLHGNYENGVQTGGRILYVRLFSIIAIFILFIACVNFMNLSTAKASRRMKEVGVKKVMGASRGSLILQFMSESMVISFLALFFSIILVAIFFVTFQQIAGNNLALHITIPVVLSFLGITIFTGLIAGSYPALYLSGFTSLTALKGKIGSSVSELIIRKGLVVFQFIISVVLIVSVFVVYKQMKFVHSSNLGFQRDNVIIFRKEGALNKNMDPFLQEVKKVPGVVNASNLGNDLVVNYSGTEGVSWPGKDVNNKTQFKYIFVGYDFVETLGIDMKEGRSFAGIGRGSNTPVIIFNEAAIKAMGLQDPVGKMVTQWGDKKTIVGVVKDFHFESFYEKVKPCFLILTPDAENVMVKIKAGKEEETISRLRQFYQAYNPGFPFEFKFLDQDYQKLYESEIRVDILSRYFAAIAIIISCLGLFGLAAFAGQKRKKEIVVRKIVGATVSSIAFMLSKDFLKLVLIAILVAFPLAGWITHQWLDGFAYRVSVGIDVYLFAGLLTIIITLITISFQTIKAALINPVKSLNAE